MKSIGILTGGGDAPGLNAVIRAVVKYGVGQNGWRLTGIEDSFNGLLCRPYRLMPLTPTSCRGILQRGGTILGTTNRGDPFDFPGPEGRVNRASDVKDAVDSLKLEGLIVVGGDGTLRIARRLMEDFGVAVLGVPKTIDNDIAATDVTFGFASAVACVSDALDRLHATAEAHDRVLILEVMGRDAGWIALHGGIAGGADVIVIPEIPWSGERIAAKISDRRKIGRQFSLVVVAEGARPAGEPIVPGKAAARVAHEIETRLPGTDVRVTVLGHLQRGGSPVAPDRVLATRYGVGAVDLVEAGRWGEMVCLRDGRIDGVRLELATQPHPVRVDDPLIHVARAVRIELGG